MGAGSSSGGGKGQITTARGPATARGSLRRSEGDAHHAMDDPSLAALRLRDLKSRQLDALSETDKADIEYALRVLATLQKPENIRPVITPSDEVDKDTANYVETFSIAGAEGPGSKTGHHWSLRGAALGIRFMARISSPRDVGDSVPDASIFHRPPFIDGSIHEWGMDMFDLAKAAEGRPLTMVGLFFFDYYSLVQEYNLDRTKLRSFLTTVEGEYQNNPYHNNIHAADVMQTIHCFIQAGMGEVLSTLEVLALLLSAAVHDVGHTGQNNAYHVNAGTEFARTYNDRSVMENHHIALAFRLLEREENNFLAGLDKKQFKAVRKIMIDSILATDMATHFAIVADFSATASAAGGLGQDKKMRLKGESKKSGRETDRNKYSHGGKAKAEESGLTGDTSGRLSAWEEPEHKSLFLKFALHCADIANSAKPWETSEPWADRVLNEFFHQGDLEKEKSLPVSPLCDRESTVKKKSQVSYVACE
mmetsp:Transcript_50604/g.130475  ORF Transcript_50604/g.130475 Transcript_50604/m.130475 type:complete len:478 (-) Transcript_50604:579-2012(-)